MARARLTKRAFIARAPRAKSEYFTASFPRDERGYAVVILKKTLPRSVDRHRLRRRVLAALHALPTPPAVIVFPRAAALRMSAPELKADLRSLLP